MPRLRPVLALLLLLSVSLPACAQGRRRAAPVPPPPPPPAVDSTLRPKLVLFLTVDQLRPEYLSRWASQFTGGLKMLNEQGVVFDEGVHDHAITETAPGHAATMSGRFPYSTGIHANGVGVNTSEAPLLQAEGVGASPFRFEGSTLTDWMTLADQRTRVLSVSRKDRGAILPIGRGIHPVYWYAQRSGVFTTSTWYGDSLPQWVRDFNAQDLAVTRYGGREWTLLLGEEHYPEPDSVPPESGGQGFQFPHAMPLDSGLARNMIIGYPWMDELTLDFAWAGVRALDLGSGPQTDLLAVSLSTTDAVGHRWGPDSRELHDHMLRLDRALGVFLDSLFALRGRENVVIALTSDHGVNPIPEVKSTFGENARAMRVREADFRPHFAPVVPMLQAARIPLEAVTFDFPVIEIDRSRVPPDAQSSIPRIARTLAAEMQRVPGVARADVVDNLARADTVEDVVARRWMHMFRRGGNQIVVITLGPYNAIGGGVAQHGSPYDYDAKVPIIFWGRAFTAGHKSGPARVVDMAPTLAHLLGITPSERLDGVILRDAFISTNP